MLLKDLYEYIVRIGIEADPRGHEGVERALQSVQKEYDALDEKQKDFFDIERLKNPYSDTRILYGAPETEVNTLLSGIDIEVGEILLADRMREKGIHIDAILSHHPEGKALSALYRVMDIQADMLSQLGVSITAAEALIDERMHEVERRCLPINHNRSVMAAQLMDIPFLCSHTPADNAVTTYLQRLFDEKKPYYLGDILDILIEMPEYRMQSKINAGPRVLVGDKKGRCGRIYVDMTGGASGPKGIYQKMAQEGLGTIVGMHISDDHKKEAEAHHINIIIAGHIGSDSLGMNLLLDRLCKKGTLEVIPCSGLVHYKRN